MISDKSCTMQILGGLMKNPLLLGQVDKYLFTIDDFSGRLEKYIFMAIGNLFENGARTITPLDVANTLETDAAAHSILIGQNGIEYLQDALEFSNLENFDYYYTRLKKLNLLRDLNKQGIDTSEFYCEDLTDPSATAINRKFEELSVQDIVERLKKKLLKLESQYAKSEEVSTENAADGIDDFIDELGTTVKVGLPIQGDIYNQIIDGAQPGALTIRSGSSGLGKALPNSTLIPTPQGMRRVDEIQPGDYLFDAFGKPTKVLNVYPQGEKEVWQVTFKDGRTAKCCEDHLWSYCTSSQKPNAKRNRRFYTSTLGELRKKELQSKNQDFRILVPMAYAAEYPEKTFLIEPYLMGLFLGDGSFRQHESNKSFQFSSQDDELPNIIGRITGWQVKRSSLKNYTWYFADPHHRSDQKKQNIWVEDVVAQYPSLLNTSSLTKFIPRDYLYGSIQQRWGLLNGLLDTDGAVDGKGRVSYFTISPQLRDGIVELCQSLGLKASVALDAHKDTNVCYIIHITGRPEDKKKMFRLSRKHALIEKWYNNGARKEANDFNPIVAITDLGYCEDMTCFYVENEEHLFLTESYSPTHNTRQAVGDACLLAYPIRYNSMTAQWEHIGNSEKVLFVITEQQMSQIRNMILAYLTDLNESKFKYGNLTEDERKLVAQAAEIMKTYKDNFIIQRIPNPTISLIKTMVREQCLMNDVHYIFYDYIFIGPALLNEFRGFNLRNDELLLLMATALKDLAVELDVSVFTSTQVNASADDNKNIRNEASLAGGRATINKADNGAIMARPSKDELEMLRPICEHYGTPNLVTDIFKVRSGEFSQVRIWSSVNLGTMKKQDLFLTDAQMNIVENFYNNTRYEVFNFEAEDEAAILKKVDELNKERAQ